MVIMGYNDKDGILKCASHVLSANVVFLVTRNLELVTVFSTLAKSDGLNGGNILTGKKTAERGNFRSFISNEAGGCVYPVKYRGGEWETVGWRVSEVFENSQRFGRGAGDTAFCLQKNRLSCSCRYRAGARFTE